MATAVVPKLQQDRFGYLKPKDVARLAEAYRFSEAAHAGQTRQSGDPYISHPLAVAEILAGWHLDGQTLMAALLHSRKTGNGLTVDLAQIEATAYMLGPTYLEASINGNDPQPQGNHFLLAAPHGCYRCAGEDLWCAISVRSDKEWQTFCRVIGRAELTSDARFVDLRARLAHRAELDAIVQNWTTSRSPEEVMNSLQSAGVPAGVVPVRYEGPHAIGSLWIS